MLRNLFRFLFPVKQIFSDIDALEKRLSCLEEKDFLLSEASYVLEVSQKEFEYLKYIAEQFNMSTREAIEFLIHKQYFFCKADEEVKASQIEAHSL